MPAIFPQTIIVNPIAILNETDGTSAKVAATGSANGTKVSTLKAFNNGVNPVDVVLSIDNGTNEAILDIVNIPANTSVNLFDDTRIPGIAPDGSMVIGENVTIKVKTQALPGAGETVDVVAEASDY